MKKDMLLAEIAGNVPLPQTGGAKVETPGMAVIMYRALKKTSVLLTFRIITTHLNALHRHII